ncbi:Methionyl-tRNA formyltransferase [hydrothermal vent metagenome]|uniref:methionyl-tRNA formyltransferase n=1 Tax=hydrothermal vent metagenome TaxID=652676 RepID=A0A3B0X4V5_9ZZZZ
MSKPLRIIYAGTPDFSAAALQALIDSEHEVIAVYTQPDRPAGRGRSVAISPVKEKAQLHSIPVYQPISLKDGNAQQQLQDLKADLMVVTAYGLLLPPQVLQMPRLGCINIHASLLPRWRGAAPIQRAILAGDKKTGITIMQMDAGLDTGDMLAVAECEIVADDTGESLRDKLMSLGSQTLMAALPAIADSTKDKIKQDDANACYASKLNKAEAKINWSLSAVEIQRTIRAYNSWPVAYCAYEKKNKVVKLRLWQAEVVNASDVRCAAGEVVAESSQGIDVKTGDGILRITELQAEGKRRMSAADFLNANSLLHQILK